MNAELLALLKVHEYFRGVPEEVIFEVLDLGNVTNYAAGDLVHEPNSPLDMVGFVLAGRLKATRVDARGHESLFRMIERGDQFGLMVGALAEPIPIRVIALEPTKVITLKYDQAMDLTYRYSELRQLWLKTFAGSLRKHFFDTSQKQAPMVLAMIHETPATRSVGIRVIERLHGMGETLAVLGDGDAWSGPSEIRFRKLWNDGKLIDPEEIRRQIVDWHDANRIIFVVPAGIATEVALRLLSFVDRAVYFVCAEASDAAVRRLTTYGVAERGWQDKISVAWVLDPKHPIAPHLPQLRTLVARDFKLTREPSPQPWGKLPHNGLERLLHDLRGVRIGVALGGGAARGMSHIGVLKVLEQSGIVVDMIAGTSAGAMTGVVYASGLDCDYSAARFAADLKPSWLFRQLPRGDQLYLLYKYRRQQFDPMLRKYLHDWRLEQLSVPCLTVTVDLVSGTSVVREQGDATHAVLESINLPVLSVPIVRSGQALIDGGLMNNIPADVLVSMGCNFVIAVSVTAKMEKRFGGIHPEVTEPTRRPGRVQILLRCLVVHNRSCPVESFWQLVSSNWA